jgi:hypothetical protein
MSGGTSVLLLGRVPHATPPLTNSVGLRVIAAREQTCDTMLSWTLAVLLARHLAALQQPRAEGHAPCILAVAMRAQRLRRVRRACAFSPHSKWA